MCIKSQSCSFVVLTVAVVPLSDAETRHGIVLDIPDILKECCFLWPTDRESSVDLRVRNKTRGERDGTRAGESPPWPRASRSPLPFIATAALCDVRLT